MNPLVATAAAYLHELSPFLWQWAPGVGIRWYGLAYVAAFLAGWWLYCRLSRAGWADLAEDKVADFFAWWVVLGTLIGGRLGYVVFYQPEMIWREPLAIVRVWEGGMSAHGGMLGLVLATWLYARTHHVSWLNLGDNLVVTAPVGLFFGRLANFVNGELYGRPANVPWAIQFPQELWQRPDLLREVWARAPQSAGMSIEQIISSLPRPPELREALITVLTPRHPSQLYEALLEGALLFAVLWLLRTRLLLPNGALTGCFFIGYALLRSVVEFVREPDSALIGPLTRGQFLSVWLLLLGVTFVVAAYLRPTWPLRHQPTPPGHSSSVPKKDFKK